RWCRPRVRSSHTTANRGNFGGSIAASCGPFTASCDRAYVIQRADEWTVFRKTVAETIRSEEPAERGHIFLIFHKFMYMRSQRSCCLMPRMSFAQPAS